MILLVRSSPKGSQISRFDRTLVQCKERRCQKHEIYYQNVQQYEASEVVSAMSNVNEVGTAVVNVPTLQI